jgi:tetratricopeptide (TPR) repeat protein
MTNPVEHEAWTAQQWCIRGSELLASNLEQAEACYRRALELDQDFHVAWFDLGLVHKRRRDWAQCLACNKRATETTSEQKGEPSYWNAGIAATALHDWPSARWAWRGYGLSISDGDGPISENFGTAAVRVAETATLWGQRIDPARIRVMSVPMPETGARCGDVILHDGAPNGTRVANGREYHVFDAIERWSASEVPTIELVVRAPESAIDDLLSLLDSHGVTAENWSANVLNLCRACSEGRVDYDAPDHNHHADGAVSGDARIGCSGDPASVEAVAAAWVDESDCAVVSLETFDAH